MNRSVVSFASNLPARLLQIRPVLQRLAHGAFDVERLGREDRAIDRIDRRPPERIVGAVDDQPLEAELRRAPRRLGLRHRLTPRGGFCLRLHDVERRHRADLHPRLVVFDEPVPPASATREQPRTASMRVEQLPVSVPHVRERRRDRPAELDFRDVAIDGRDAELLPVVVDEKSAQQRLGERRG